MKSKRKKKKKKIRRTIPIHIESPGQGKILIKLSTYRPFRLGSIDTIQAILFCKGRAIYDCADLYDFLYLYSYCGEKESHKPTDFSAQIKSRIGPPPCVDVLGLTLG